jgi:hypothetical protein
MTHVPLRARLSELEGPEQGALKDWYTNGLHKGEHSDRHGKVGLWVCGPRRYGTSYIAECATAKLEPRVSTWEHVAALTLTESIRSHWGQSEMVRRNPDDYNLFLEAQEVESMLDFLWHRCEVLWVDDFHEDTVDIPFWRKHVQPRLERRIKDGLPTIVATTLPPDHVKLSGLRDVIEDLFVICVAETPIRERRQRVVRPYDDATG